MEEFTLSNRRGLTIKVITYGGIINELHVPDRTGSLADVVLGFDNLQDYLGEQPYLGAIIGRVAGRITGGRFTLEGRGCQLAVNNPPNHLHGGWVGFDKRNWKPTVLTLENGIPGLKLAYRSPDGEEGYPGNVDAFVTYLLSDDDEVIIRYEATTDRATPLSLTNHSYFNLAGEGSGSIEGQSLQIFSEETAATDPSMTLLGKRLSVVGEVTDFRQTKKLGDSIPLLMNAHGDNYFFRRNARRTPELVARMSDPASGRVMEVSTTEDCMQVYTAAFMDGTLRGKCGQTYEKHSGLALECQGYPDGVSHPELGDIILRPGETYRQTTIYKFATE